MLSFPATYNAPPAAPQEPPPLPRRTASLSSSIAKPKPTSPLVQSNEDLQFAKAVLATPITTDRDADENEDAREQRREERERNLIEMLARMTGWVEELSSLLQQAYKNQTELETAVTLTRSNLQLALANNEMLEEALKRGGKDVGWRRWSEREGVRRTSSVKEYTQHDRPNSVAEVPPNASPPQPQPPPTGTSRFFNFKSPLQRTSSNNTSPTSAQGPSASTPSTSPTSAAPYSHVPSASSPSLLPSVSIAPSSRSQTPANSAPVASRPPSPPSPSDREKELTAMLQKERVALQKVAKEKMELEEELESLSQALFEEANKMVSKANRKLAETEEELRVATAQKEALKGALIIVEGENGQLRGSSTSLSESEHEEEPEQRGRQRPPEPESTPSRVDDPPHEPSTPRAADTSEPPALSATIPDLTVSEAAKSFWSPLTPGTSASTLTPTITKSGHRWSLLPRTPRSRSAVRNEFEDAMRRMQDIVGEDGAEGEEAKAPAAGAGGLRAEDARPAEGAADGDSEPTSPGIEFAARQSPSSESEVEDEVKVRAVNPWTS